MAKKKEANVTQVKNAEAPREWTLSEKVEMFLAGKPCNDCHPKHQCEGCVFAGRNRFIPRKEKKELYYA